MSTTGNPKKRPHSEVSPDKSALKPWMFAVNATRSVHLVKVSPFNVIFVVCGPMLTVREFLVTTLKLSSHYSH